MPHIPSYDCTSRDVWIDLESLNTVYMDSHLSININAIKILGLCKIPIYLIQFMAHYNLMMRYYKDSSEEAMGD